jgi:hypothetical protein
MDEMYDVQYVHSVQLAVLGTGSDTVLIIFNKKQAFCLMKPCFTYPYLYSDVSVPTASLADLSPSLGARCAQRSAYDAEPPSKSMQ